MDTDIATITGKVRLPALDSFIRICGWIENIGKNIGRFARRTSRTTKGVLALVYVVREIDY